MFQRSFKRYNCFAPILLHKEMKPNLFWAVCPYQKKTCQILVNERGSCLNEWMTSTQTGISWTSDVLYLLRGPISEAAKLWNLPDSKNDPIVIRWEDFKPLYSKALLSWWLSLGIGNGIILLWFIFRKPFLKYCCTENADNVRFKMIR